MDTTKTGNAPQPPQIGSQPINLWITKLSFCISDPDLLHIQFTAYLPNYQTQKYISIGKW